jgi:hypothetical protein
LGIKVRDVLFQCAFHLAASFMCTGTDTTLKAALMKRRGAGNGQKRSS